MKHVTYGVLENDCVVILFQRKEINMKNNFWGKKIKKDCSSINSNFNGIIVKTIRSLSL